MDKADEKKLKKLRASIAYNDKECRREIALRRKAGNYKSVDLYNIRYEYYHSDNKWIEYEIDCILTNNAVLDAKKYDITLHDKTNSTFWYLEDDEEYYLTTKGLIDAHQRIKKEKREISNHRLAMFATYSSFVIGIMGMVIVLISVCNRPSNTSSTAKEMIPQETSIGIEESVEMSAPQIVNIQKVIIPVKACKDSSENGKTE